MYLSHFPILHQEFFKCTLHVQLKFLPSLSACPPGFYGIGCAEQCDCANGATCDHVSGACYCTPGWRGMRCDKPCPQGFFGRECQQLCQCDNGADCDHVTGKCRCAAGKSQDVSGCSTRVTTDVRYMWFDCILWEQVNIAIKQNYWSNMLCWNVNVLVYFRTRQDVNNLSLASLYDLISFLLIYLRSKSLKVLNVCMQ